MSAQPIHDLTTSGQRPLDAHGSCAAGGDPSADLGQSPLATQRGRAEVGTHPTTSGQRPCDTQRERADGGDPSPPAEAITGPALSVAAPQPEDALLLIYADALDDFERVRIATANRLRSLEQVKGLSGTPEAERMQATIDTLAALEHGVTLDLKRAMRKHPLGAWVKRSPGVGEKQAARLLATIGDPTTRTNPAQLWAYCGLAPGQRRQAGVKSNWSTKGKSRAWLIAEAITKQTCPACRAASAVKKSTGEALSWTPPPPNCTCAEVSPYRHVYDAYRVAHIDAVHTTECKQCGPKGKPAQPGSPLSPGHHKARAMRYLSKRILRDIWREAKAHG